MEHKTYQGELKKITEKGEGEAIFATLNAIDSDGDVTIAGAFGEQTVQMVPAHDWTKTPIGKAQIKEQGDHAIASFKLNLDNRLGKDWYAALKFDLDNPPSKQQWSYGFTILEEGNGEFEERQVRFLKKLRVHEISPVLVGAGVGTGTLRLKEEKKTLEDQIKGVMDEIRAVIQRVTELHELRSKDGRTISKERLKELFDLKKLINEFDCLLETVDDKAGSEAVMRFHELQNKILDFKKVLL